MGSIVDGAMALLGLMAGLMLVISTLKASESPAEPAYQRVKAENQPRKAA